MKNVWIGVIVLAVIGFVGLTEHRKGYMVAGERLSGGEMQVALDPATDYRVEIWGVDEELGMEWADLLAHVSLLNEKGAVIDAREIAASGSDDSGGVKRAQAGYSVDLSGIAKLRVKVAISKGDYVDVEVFKAMPVWVDLGPGLSILVAIAAFVLMLRRGSKSAGKGA
jgi:hypothetical protein